MDKAPMSNEVLDNDVTSSKTGNQSGNHASQETRGPSDLRQSPLYRLRHSLAHVLAQAVREIRPKARLGYGPPTENGFFYDIEAQPPLSESDLPELETRMRRIIKDDLPMRMVFQPAKDVIAQLEAEDASYKLEMARQFIAQGETQLGLCHTGNAFTDMCQGHHVPSTGTIPPNAFQLDSIAGAYWRNDPQNPMLQRVYGLAFPTAKALRNFLTQREQAKARDHRKLGQQLGLFTINEAVGKGLPLFMPAGAAIRQELENLAFEMEFDAGYERVSTPHITRAELFERSGHLPYYAKDMFPPWRSTEKRSTSNR